MPKRRRFDLCTKNRESDDLPDDVYNDSTEIDNAKQKVSVEAEKVLASSVLSSIDNLKAVDSTNMTLSEATSEVVKSPLSTDLSSIRRKSNRILSLKRSFQQQLSSNNEELPNQISLDSSADSTKAISTSDVSSSTQSGSQVQSNQTKHGDTTGTTTGPTKSLRKVQAWTPDDQRWFFEALCEHGKEFHQIQGYIATRCEKKGIPSDSIKNYEQVRHFYYRMWHKISQCLNFSNEVEKGVQEIYGLINYGEIWKKFGFKFDNKQLSIHLQQLVDVGYTVVKVKGKSVRVRTPICNALKKFHNIDSKVSKPATQSLPKEVIVELRPATNIDWLRVHSLAQNPRLRTRMALQHRLSSLIDYLEKRWEMLRAIQSASHSSMGIVLKDEELQLSERYRLRLRPHQAVKLCEKVTLKSTSNSISYHNYRSTSHGSAQIDLSLNAYLKVLENDSSLALKKSKVKKSKKSNQVETININETDNTDINKESNVKNEEDETKNQEEKEPTGTTQSFDLLKLLDSMNEELEVSSGKKNQPTTSSFESTYETEPPSVECRDELPSETESGNQDELIFPEPPEHKTLAEWLSGDLEEEEDEKITNGDISPTSQNNKDSKGGRKRRASTDCDLVELIAAKQALLGWNREEAESITIGELYLLLEHPNKIVLEYSWELIETNDKPTQNSSNRDSESIPEIENTKEDIKIKPTRSTIEKFLIAANLTLMSFKKYNSVLSNSQARSGSKSSTSEKTRKREPKAAASQPTSNSHLLSNLIQETILSDNTESSKVQQSDSNSKSCGNASSSSNSGKLTETSTTFATPRVPPSRSQSSITNKVNKSRSTTVLEDPIKVEEVLKGLNITNFRRQRRPMPKMIYNPPNKMIASNSARVNVNNQRQFILIPTSHLTSGEGSNSKQIVLTTHIPQGSIHSLSHGASNIPTTKAQLGTSSSVVIPIQVETSPIATEMVNAHTITVSAASQYMTLDKSNETPITSSTPNTTSFDSIIFNNSNPTPTLSSNLLSSNYTPMESSKATEIYSAPMSKLDEHSNMSWLNSDLSLSSLFATEELIGNKMMTDSSSAMGISAEMDTHISSLANENSVDLIAKFTDLAEQITSDSKQM